MKVTKKKVNETVKALEKRLKATAPKPGTLLIARSCAGSGRLTDVFRVHKDYTPRVTYVTDARTGKRVCPEVLITVEKLTGNPLGTVVADPNSRPILTVNVRGMQEPNDKQLSDAIDAFSAQVETYIAKVAKDARKLKESTLKELFR